MENSKGKLANGPFHSKTKVSGHFPQRKAAYKAKLKKKSRKEQKTA